MIRLRADTRRVGRVTAVAVFARFGRDLAGVFLRGAGSNKAGIGVGTVLGAMALAAFGFWGHAAAFAGLGAVTPGTSGLVFAGLDELVTDFKLLGVSDLDALAFRTADTFVTGAEGADFVRTRRTAGWADLEAVDFFFIENRCGAGVAMDRLRRKLYVQRDGGATGISKGTVARKRAA
jgi:hypothetical protein